MFVIIGALLSVITTTLVERSKGKRELARRFDNEIREAGAAFLTKADEYYELAKAAQEAVQRSGRAKDYAQTTRETPEAKRIARTEAAKALQPLSFVAPESFIRAARIHLLHISITVVKDEILTSAARETIARDRKSVVDEVRRTIKLPASEIGKKKTRRAVFRDWIKNAKNKTEVPIGVLAVLAVLLLVVGVWIGTLLD